MSVKVRNMTSPTSGREIPNQFLIETDDGVMFQSYSTSIAFRGRDGKVKLNRDMWDYSSTTGKYRNRFLGEGIAETRKKVADGTYELVTL